MTLLIGGRRVAKPDDEPKASSSIDPGDYEEAALAQQLTEALQSKGMLERAHLVVALGLFSEYVRQPKEESFTSIEALAIQNRASVPEARFFPAWWLRPTDSQELLGTHHIRIGKPQRRHERSVDMGSRDDEAVEFQVAAGTGVVHHRDFVAHVRRSAGNAVDAHVAHATDDNQPLDAVLLEDRLQFGFAK